MARDELRQQLYKVKSLNLDLDQIESELHRLNQHSPHVPHRSTYLTLISDPSTPQSGCASVSKSPSSTWAIKRKKGERRFMRWAFLMSPSGLIFQLRLTMLSDLERLLRGHFVIDNSSILTSKMSRFNCTTSFKEQEQELFYETYWPYTGDELLPWTTFDTASDTHTQISTLMKPNLLDYLFHMYLGECYTGCPHANRAELLEQYQKGTLPPSLLYSALAFSASHEYTCHATSYPHHLPSIASHFYDKAKLAIEDALDVPSRDSVLALFNLHLCANMLGEMRRARAYLGHAMEMARALQMDRDDPHEKDLVKLETVRRIWYSLILADMIVAIYTHSSPICSWEIIKTSPRPRPLPGECVEASRLLIRIAIGVELISKVSRYPGFNPNQLTDTNVLETLIPVCTLLHHAYHVYSDVAKDEGDSNLSWSSIEASFIFWESWGCIFSRVLESDALGSRLDEALIRKLKEIAFEMCTKAASKLMEGLQLSVHVKRWCKSFFFATVKTICHLVRIIVLTHPSRDIRIGILHQFETTLDMLQGENAGKIKVEGRWSREFESTIVYLRPYVTF
ncbi:uncharacterized protein VTP21DRAFT_11429 [Calcarisporiella thermophila]|uniref:uncharacterized protein n=1 Tax=Calcarisporiella thermophila TaxID=911321 RepID=UPI0037445F71